MRIIKKLSGCRIDRKWDRDTSHKFENYPFLDRAAKVRKIIMQIYQ